MLRTIHPDDQTQRPRDPSPRLSRPARERVRRKPRDPDERQTLIKLARAKWDLYIASGQLEIIGPRAYRLHMGEDRVIEYLRRQDKL